MSTFQFREAKRENIHALIGVMGGTGSGKTFSAMRLATGLAGGKKFAVIDTEAGRAKHYADDFKFDHGDLPPPHSPGAYLEAIAAAEAAGYPVIVVDSMSHEHAGDGGLLDMHEAEFQRLGGRDAVKMTAWIKPKMAHKSMVSKLLQLRSHLILCFRAEPKVKIGKDANGKVQITDAGWQPICAKGLEFEMTVSFLLSHERPGLPDHPLKLPAALRSAFPAGRAIDEDAGRAVAAWAAGGKGAATTAPSDPILDSAEALLVTVGLCERDELVALFKARGMPQNGQPAPWSALPHADKAAIETALRERCQVLKIDGIKELKKLAEAAT